MRNVDRKTKFKRNLVRDERGMALILTLSMLTILSVLGAFALTTTNTELGVTANFRSGRESFMAADRILAYAKALVIDSGASSSVPLSGTQHEANLEAGDGGYNSMDDNETSEIAFVDSGSGPEVYYGKKDAGDVIGIYFRASTTGQSSTGRSKTRLESSFFAVTKIGSNDGNNWGD